MSKILGKGIVTICLPTDSLNSFTLPALADFGDDLAVGSPYLQTSWTSRDCK